jgi:hypothetical protein
LQSVFSLYLRVRERTAMQEIADWLEKLGMSEYAELFAESKINMPALRYLTDQDKGHRHAAWTSADKDEAVRSRRVWLRSVLASSLA